MARIAWQFTDPIAIETYDLLINPNEGGTPSKGKSMTYLNTAGADGKILAFEGRAAAEQVTVSGVILIQEHYDKLLEWYNKNNFINIVDDLGRSFNVYITGFSAQRQRSVSHPWRHNYTLTYVIVD
jgi:hypothetical protein